MKIAVPFENGMVFQHFGRSEQFKFYEVENGAVLHSEVVSTNGQGHGALVGFLVQHGANVVLCGGIGTGAQVALMQAGIQMVIPAMNTRAAAPEAPIEFRLQTGLLSRSVFFRQNFLAFSIDKIKPALL